MSVVKITSNRKRRLFVKPLLYSRTLPDQWTDLKAVQLRFCIDQLLKYKNPNDARFWILKKLIKLPKSIFVNLENEVVADLIGTLSWMKLEPNTKPLISSFEHDDIVYHLPKEKFMNGSALEYPIADDYLQKFIASGKMADLNMLIATICRPGKTDEKEVLKSGDIRIQLNSRLEIEKRAKELSRLPDHIKISVLLYFAAVKNYIFDTYKGWLFPDDTAVDLNGDELPVDPEEDSKGPMFGWWSVYFNVAETGVFGNLEQVHQSNFHTICMFLVDQKKKEDELRQNNKSNNA